MAVEHDTAETHEYAAADSAAASVSLSTQYEIHLSRPLPALDTLGARAYSARHVRDPKDDVFALVCQTDMPVRQDVLQAIRHMQHPGMLDVMDWGVVDWPPEQRRRFAMIVERPNGRRLMRGIDDTREPMTPDQIVRWVVVPIIGILKELRGRGLHHASVRPWNMFMRDLAAPSATLGECFVVPPGYRQPSILEPLERAMAQPAGRGVGGATDDLFALGVSILFLYAGRNPVPNYDEKAFLATRIESGTFAALTEAVRVPTQLTEPLRGLIVDDARLRWSLDDVELWAAGRRLSPRQVHAPKQATRPVIFAGREYWHPRGLAAALAGDVKGAAEILASGDITKWLRRGLSDPERAEAVEAAIEGATGGGRLPASDDRVVARVGVALDPAAPIRYKGAAVLPEGFGAALAEAFLTGGSPQVLAEMVLSQFAHFWVNMQPEVHPEFGTIVSLQEQARGFLEKSAPGQGIERILYELNPSLTCLSPAVHNFYPLTPKDLLLALEQTAQSRDRPRDPVDRHICAWLAARYKHVDARLLRETVQNEDPVRRAAAILAVYAELQHRVGQPPLPNLCSWIATFLPPAVARFRNLKYREKLRDDIDKAVSEGNLGTLLTLVDDPAELRKDQIGFLRARKSWRMAQGRIEALERDRDRRGDVVTSLGRQSAAVIAGSLAAVVIVVLLFMRAF